MDNAKAVLQPQARPAQQTEPQRQKPPDQPVTVRQKRQKIYVCSPYRLTSLTPDGMERERVENEKRIQMACWLIVKEGGIPYAPHGYFTRFLDDSDPAERAEGMALGLEWLSECDELWVFGERISDGMAREIAYAKERGIPVLCKLEPKELMERLLIELKKGYGAADGSTTDGADAAVSGSETEDNNGKEN